MHKIRTTVRIKTVKKKMKSNIESKQKNNAKIYTTGLYISLPLQYKQQPQLKKSKSQFFTSHIYLSSKYGIILMKQIDS